MKNKRPGKKTATASTRKLTTTAADADAATSVFQLVSYTSPYQTLPPGYSTSGVLVQTNASQSPSGKVLVIRLRQASNGYVIGVSATSGPGTGNKTATYQPSFPLSSTDPYMVDIIWVTSGTPPDNIDWTQAAGSAPVISSEISIRSARYDGTNVYATLAYGTSGAGTGAQVTVYSLSGGTLVNVGKAQTENNYATVPVNAAGYPQVFFISAQAAIPVTNTGSGSFTAPFSVGPQTVILNSSGTALYGGIPQAVNAITKADYNGTTLSLTWSLASVSNCVNPDSSIVRIMSGTQVIGTFIGGVTSANFELNVFGQSGISVSVCTVADGISSVPVSLSLITAAPVLTNVTANVANSTVTASYTTVPASLPVQASLLEGSRQLASGTGTAGALSIAYAAAGMVGLSVTARAASADGITLGPPCAPAGLLATAPVLQIANIYTNPSNSAQWQIDMSWEQLPDDAAIVASYTASLYQETTSLVTQVVKGTSTSLFVNKTAVTSGQAQSLQLSATSASGGTSPVQTYYAVFSAPVLSALATGTNQITASWNAPVIPAANTRPVNYRVIATVNGKTAFISESLRATQGAVPLSLLPAASSSAVLIMVNIALGNVNLIPDSSMATGTSASPILLSPVIGKVNVAAVTNISTLNWSAVPDANVSQYTINLLQQNQQVTSASTSYSLTTALSPGSLQNYTVQATGTSNGVALTGPPSSVMTVPTSSCNVTNVHFNGTTVLASWESMGDASLYNLWVYDNSSPANKIYEGTTTQTFASFAVTITDKTKVYTLYVQPATATGAGLSGVTMPLFSPALFLSQQPASSAYPYIYPGSSMAMLGTSATNPTAQAINLYLPELGSQSGALGTQPLTVDPFQLTPLDSGPMPYQLTIMGNSNAWGFDTSAVRATLVQSYVNFLKLLEAPGAGLSGAVPYGISLVQAAIACMLPQTFAEQLYYNFGFSTSSSVGAGYIDLRPGMILRVSTGDYISINQSNLPSWINGYAGASVLDFEIGSYTAGTNWRAGFDNFLNVLAAAGALNVTTPASSVNNTQAGLAGSVDLYYPQFVQPFYRLYFPSSITIPWGTGSNATTSNFTLVAAQSYTSLQNTTVDPNVTPTAYFRGRTIVEVMIRVLVNNYEHIVPSGTTLGNLLEQLNLRVSATSPLFNTLRLYRSIAAAMNNVNTASSTGPMMEVSLDWNGMQIYSTGNGLNTLSIPVMPGDQIVIS